MDDLEKRIIRKKKGAFMEHLQITDNFLDELRVKQIFPADAIDSMQGEKINGARVTKLMDCVLSSPEPYEILSGILRKDYAWLARDMEAEILGERGVLVIEEDMLRETGMMVHRKFGSSKRLCEADKREIQELMALKLQIAKGEFKQEVGKVKEDLDKQTQINIASEKLAAKMMEKTKKFLKDRDTQLATHAHGLLTTKDVLQLSLAEMAYSSLEKFEKYSEYVLLKFGSILNQRDTLIGERDRCLRIMKVDADTDLALDEVLKLHKDKETKKAQQLQKEAAAKNVSASKESENAYMVKRLNSKISDLETALDEKDDKIRELEQKLKEVKSAPVTLTTLEEVEPINGVVGERNGSESVNTDKRRASTGNVKKKSTTKRGSFSALSKPRK